ncbi:uncharacterized protein PFLUO_LOCUS9069 [Penicillium psychrofluorescens]|uniref:uncharacterized protein n=1 Tax=Penicillium psychrofluorescens TaxID=3158075 RepID=UPI003CCD453E
MARLLDIKAQIFVPQHMDYATRNLIAKEGADVIVVPGDYDEAVKQGTEASKQVAEALLIQDTAFEGYEDIPAWIVEGYSTMMTEIDDQLAQLGLIGSVMVTPVGVGSLAHAVARHCKSRENPLAVVAVEPDSAPCLSANLSAGQSVTVQTGATIMDGMNCGTLSATAWPDLQQLVDSCVTVSCYETHRALQYLSLYSIPVGPCGGASLAAIRRLASSEKDPSFLNKDSVVVLLGTEGTRDYQIPRDVSIDDAVSLTKTLTCIDSSNPTLSVADGAGETQIVNYLASWFAHRDIEYHKIESVAGRPSIVGIIRGSGGGKSLMFNGHVDTVSLSSYEKDPLSGSIGMKEEKEVVFGRGSLDMKGGLAAALAAMSAIKASGRVSRGDVIVAAVADEEDASQGTQDVLAAGWRADAAIVAEPTMGAIATAHKGFLWVEVDILGIAAHGSKPHEGEDAILHSGWFLRALEQYQRNLPVDDTLGQASLHCGLIRGGDEPSSYPGKCSITVEFRTIPCQTEELILRDMNVLLSDISKEDARFRYAEPRVTLSRPTQKLATDHPLVEKTAACASTILGTRPAIQSVSFWCDAALLSQAGIPSIVYGPTGAGLHSKEEWVEVDSLRQMERVYLEVVRQFCY